jgi:N-acetylglucosaminyldiphosphoundecaprenol N-acetyl-beta-D-mannosaminyltransferase
MTDSPFLIGETAALVFARPFRRKGMTVAEVELATSVREDSDAAPIEKTVGGHQPVPGTDFYRDVHCVFGLPIDVIPIERALFEVREASARRTRCFLSTPNLNYLVASQRDSHFRNSVLCSDLSLTDGVPLVWLGKLIGVSDIKRVAGSTLFERLVAETTTRMSVYFFGGGQGASGLAAAVLNSRHGGVNCVGSSYPGFGSVEEMSRADMIDEINRCAPDFLIVALAAKKGQAWLQHNQHRIKAPVISNLGAVVNFAAGTIRRAPRWVQDAGFEWAWRIKEEPALWRRYLGDGLTLAKLLALRAIPCCFHRLARPHGQLFRHATVAVRRSEGTCHVELAGPRDQGNLDPVRQAFSEAVAVPCDVVVHMRGVAYVDSAFLGLCLLLYGHQIKTDRALRFEGLSSQMKKVFRANCVEYLLV